MHSYLIVIPFYDKFDSINRCMESILAAKNKAIDLIEKLNIVIVDDGSKSKELSLEDINCYESFESVHVSRIPNSGCAQARLHGIKVGAINMSDDTYVIHIDPDDTIMDDMFIQIDSWINKFPEVDVLVGNLLMYDCGVYNPYIITPALNRMIGKVYPPEIGNCLSQGHPVIYKYAKLGLWKKCLDNCNLRINCCEDLFLTVLLYRYVKTVVYTDILYYEYEYGQSTSIMSGAKDEPMDSRITYMYARYMENINGDIIKEVY